MNGSQSSKQLDEKTIAIVGVGLIGGSIAAALKKRGYAGRIVGVGRNRQRLAAAKAGGLIDDESLDITEAAADADLLVFCTPVNLIVDGVLAAAAVVKPNTIITDAGSVKGGICRALSGKLPADATFIGSHPLAGSEQQGFEYADGDLFEGRICVVTPDEKTPVEQLARLKVFWQFLGCGVIERSSDEHDRVLAETSHMPHVVAAAMAATVSPKNRSLAASGFRDTTRIASGDPDLWTAILLANSDDVIAGLETFAENLQEFRACIANRDAIALKKLLQDAKTARESVDGVQ